MNFFFTYIYIYIYIIYKFFLYTFLFNSIKLTYIYKLDPFLRAYYSVFDPVKNQVGFATAVQH